MTTKKKTWLIILIVSVVLIGIGAGIAGFIFFDDEDTLGKYHDHSKDPVTGDNSALVGDAQSGRDDPSQSQTPDGVIIQTPSVSSGQTPNGENPIDFDSLLETNSDIRGWIYIPNTNIDYPVLCSTVESDDYYLDHNYLRQYEFDGSIYFEKQNAVDFSDRNTVMYGHNLLNGRMFRTLHYFENEEFFNENPYIYIYVPGQMYTYTIFAAYVYDDRHILNSFDFDDDKVWEEYLAYATNPQSMKVHTRDVEVTTDDRIITLSTCVGSDKNSRYLVQGVLTHVQSTQ